MRSTFTFIFFMVLLCNCLVASGQTAVAPAGAGTSANPYRIASLSNLYWLSQNSAQWASDKYYIQTADIDASATSTWFSDGSGGYYGFPCIGGYSYVAGNQVAGIFSGKYDGQGYRISNLYINRSPQFVALFGYCDAAVLSNINLVNPTVHVGATGSTSSNGYSGQAIFMASGSATLDNIHIINGSLTITSMFGYSGGMLGRVGNVQAANCSVQATINLNTSSAGPSGGFLGYAESACTFTNCSSSGNVVSNQNRAGGFAGSVFGTGFVFTNCNSAVNVTGTTVAGGFIGALYSGVVFTDCYARGSVTISSSNAGGFVGSESTGPGGAPASTLTRCYATGAVSGSSSGGFSANALNTYINCFWDNQTSGKSVAFGSGSGSGVTGRTTSQMKTLSTFTGAGYDFINETTNGTNDYWFLDAGENNGYPALVGNIREWSGATSTNWSTASNWKNGILPTATSIIRIGSSAVNLPAISSNTSVDRFSFNGVNHIMDLGDNQFTCKQVLAHGPGRYIQTSGTGTLLIAVANNAMAVFPVGNSAYNPVHIGNSTGSSDQFTVRVLDEVYVNGSSGTEVNLPRVKRTWDISKTNANGGSGITFLFNWNSDEADQVVTPALNHFEGGKWVQQTGTSSATATSLTYSGYTGTFSPFAIGDVSTPLPVTWLGFSAQKQNDHVLLKWETSHEENAKDFIIQHSTDGHEWKHVGAVAAKGNGSAYSYIHTTPAKGVNHYRLQQRDIDDRFSYSKVVSLNMERTGQLLVYPNPVKQGMVNIVTEEKTTLRVFNAAGTQVLQKELQPGKTSLNISGWAKGIYRFLVNEKPSTLIVQ